MQDNNENIDENENMIYNTLEEDHRLLSFTLVGMGLAFNAGATYVGGIAAYPLNFLAGASIADALVSTIYPYRHVIRNAFNGLEQGNLTIDDVNRLATEFSNIHSPSVNHQAQLQRQRENNQNNQYAINP